MPRKLFAFFQHCAEVSVGGHENWTVVVLVKKFYDDLSEGCLISAILGADVDGEGGLKRVPIQETRVLVAFDSNANFSGFIVNAESEEGKKKNRFFQPFISRYSSRPCEEETKIEQYMEYWTDWIFRDKRRTCIITTARFDSGSCFPQRSACKVT